jgi:multidrug resistance efflux pump
MSYSEPVSGALSEALEASRPAVEAALREAEAELGELRARTDELEALIARAHALLGREPAPKETAARLTLHEALAQILREHGNQWMTVRELAEAVNTSGLYRKRDGSFVEPSQIHARSKNYERLFEKEGSRIRLRGVPSTHAPEAGA